MKHGVHIRATVRWVSLLALLAPAAHAGSLPIITKCPPDAVLVGQTCVDTYEASVWQIPTTNTGLINRVKKGTVRLSDLTSGRATQISAESNFNCSPSFPSTFPVNGQWTQPLYALSVPGVHPTACVSWFQADQACALSGKRLLTNAEWQRAAAGTPDSPTGADNGVSDCAINSPDAVNTGSRTNCKSSWGAFDMVGNVDEWVADWVPLSTSCTGWGSFSDDYMCLAGADATTPGGPGALVRGGYWAGGTLDGVFAVGGSDQPAEQGAPGLGFRCAR